MSNETELQKIVRLKKAQYSVRQIAKNIGISKSQVQRILEENKKNELSQPSQIVSQTVSQSSQRELGTVLRPSQMVSQAKRDSEKEELKTERKLKEKEHALKSQFDLEFICLLEQKDFSSSELNDIINTLEEGKGIVDSLSHEVTEFTGNENFEFSTFLKGLLIHLRKARIKMETFSYKELKYNREFTFEKGLRLVEYEEQEEEENEEYEDTEQDEPQEEKVIVVKLWNKYNSLKSSIEQKLKIDGLGFEW